jgi:predicted component of type VI protein secretion system
VIAFHILNGSKAGTQWVACRLPIRIGRSPEDDLQIADPGVWDHHLRIELREGRHAAFVATPDALTTVNGQPAQDASLRSGDIINLGSLRLQFGLSPTTHRRLRLRETLTWIALTLLSLGEIALIYALAVAP